MSNSSDVRMRWLRRRMGLLGIDINDSKNGVWLPKNSDYRLQGKNTTAHGGEGVHGNAYKQHVWDTLKNARTKADFETRLEQLKEELNTVKTFPVQ